MLDPIPRLAATHLRDDSDMLEWAWVLGYGANQLLANPLAIFDANILYPFRQPLAYGESTLTNIVLGAPVVWATGNAVLAENYLIVLSFVLAGYGTYLLVKDLTGSAAAGIVAGVVFAFCPYRQEKLIHLPFLTAQWLPFIFWSLNRHLRRGAWRWAVAFGGFLLLQFLTAFTIAYVTSFAVAAYLLVVTLASPSAVLRPRVVLPLLLAVGVGLAALAVVSGPYFAVSDRYGMARGIEEVIGWSASPGSYISPSGFDHVWGGVQWLFDLGGGEKRMFIGAVAAALALVGIFAGRPRSRGLAFLAVGFTCFVLSLGPAPRPLPPTNLVLPMPYLFLYDHFPGFQSMRVPARFAIGVMLGIGGLAGLGAARLIGWLGRARGSRAAVATLLAGLVLVEFAGFPLTVKPIPTGAAIPEVYQWLRAQPEKGALIELPINNKEPGQDFDTYYASYHGWKIMNGWRSFFPPGYAELVDLMRGFPSDDSLRLLANLNLRYVVVHDAAFKPEELPALRARLDAQTDRLRLVRRFGGDAVYELRVPAVAPKLRIDLVNDCEASAGGAFPLHLVYRTPGASVVAIPNLPPRLAVSADWRASDGRTFHQDLTVESPDALLRADRAWRIDAVAPPEPGTWTLAVGVSPRIVPDLTLPEPRVVTVRGRGEPRDDSPPRLTAVRLLDEVAAPGHPLRVQASWSTSCPCACLATASVNVYDASSRVWSNGNRSDVGAKAGTDDADCFGGAADETREVTLAPDTPTGYYFAEIVVLDPVTGQRRSFVGPDGDLTTKVALGRIRVADAGRAAFAFADPENAAKASFGGQIALAGWGLSATTARPGGSVDLALRWRALDAIPADYSVFVHLYDREGKLVTQADGGPGGGGWPTSGWRAGETLVDDRHLALPADLKPGEYTLAVGVYDPATGMRLPVAGGADMGDSRLVITRLTVDGR